MNLLQKFLANIAAVRGIDTLRQAKYIALVIAIASLGWSGYLLTDTQRRDEAAVVRSRDLSRTVSELRMQVARQHAATSTIAPATFDDEPTADALIARVGAAARRSGLRLAQSRVVASPTSAQPAAPPIPPNGAQAPAAPNGAQVSAPPPADPGGVEFHLTGSYAGLQKLLKAFGASRSRFQVVTLDVLRAKVAEKTGIAQLDIRLVCVL